MAYTPNNSLVFNAAYVGAYAGIVAASNYLSVTNSSLYNNRATYAGAWAQCFDTLWGATAPNSLQLDSIETESFGLWSSRPPFPDSPKSTVFSTASTYTALCNALIASITASSNYFSGQGITPPSPYVPSATASGRFVYQPGGTAYGNIYTTEASLRTAVLAYAGNIPGNGPVEILIDLSVEQATTTTWSLNWNLTSALSLIGNVSISGAGGPSSSPVTPQLVIAGQVGFYSTLNITDLQVVVTNGGSLVPGWNSDTINLHGTANIDQANATAAAFTLGGGSNTVTIFNLYDQSSIGDGTTGAGTSVLYITPASDSPPNCIINLFGSATLYPNATNNQNTGIGPSVSVNINSAFATYTTQLNATTPAIPVIAFGGAAWSEQSTSFTVTAGTLANFGINTTASAVTMRLPGPTNSQTPSLNEIHEFCDETGSFATHNFTIDGQGNNVMGPSGAFAATAVFSAGGYAGRVRWNGTNWVLL